MQPDPLEAERQRARALLAPERLGFALEACDPNPLPAALGALAGLAWRAPQVAVRVNVYIFADWGQGVATATVLENMVNGDGYLAQTAVNGALMCLGVTDTPSAAAEQCLTQVLSAFAGLE